MKPRSILKWSLIPVGVLPVVLAGLLAWAAFVPPTRYPPPRPAIPDQSAFRLDEKVGWYALDDGTRRLVTWGADGSLTINDFRAVRNYYLRPRTADDFVWVDHLRKLEYPGSFQRDAAGAISGFAWTTADGVRHAATRVPDEGYRQSDVRFANGEVELSGLLLSPLSAGPHPAVVFIHGSGVSDRDILWYSQMGDHLARNGITVLLPDKRGCGRSKGRWETSSFDDYAGDALAAVSYLREHEPVRPDAVGLIGMSQGGWVAPLAASRSRDVGFVVVFSGSATPIRHTARYELEVDMRDSGCPRWLVSIAAPAFMRRIANRTPDFWRLNGAFDPLPLWRRLEVPALVLNGELDKNVPVAESVALLERVRQESPGVAITIHVYPGTGHGISDDQTRRLRPDALGAMVDWIGAVAERAPGTASPPGTPVAASGSTMVGRSGGLSSPERGHLRPPRRRPRGQTGVPCGHGGDEVGACTHA